MQVPAPRRRKQIQSLITIREDAEALSAALRAAFPTVRFLARAYWEQFIDWDAYRAALAERDERTKRGERYYDVPHVSRDPGGQHPRFYESMGESSLRSWRAWLLPDDWQPQWELDTSGTYFIANQSIATLLYTRSEFVALSRPTGAQHRFSDPPTPVDDDEEIWLSDHIFGGFYNRDDPLGKSFVMKAFRIVTKLSTNRVILVDPKTLRPKYLQASGEAGTRVGHRAAAWSLERRHNYFRYHIKAEGFPYHPSEVLPETVTE